MRKENALRPFGDTGFGEDDSDSLEAVFGAGEVDDILRRQDEAMALLERLRAAEPLLNPRASQKGGGRRDFRRWPTPPGVTLEFHDGVKWHGVVTADMGVGGARLGGLPRWVEGPIPARLCAPGVGSVLVLADVMWKGGGKAAAGVRFEFQDTEQQEQWSSALIDALLSQYAAQDQ